MTIRLGIVFMLAAVIIMIEVYDIPWYWALCLALLSDLDFEYSRD